MRIRTSTYFAQFRCYEYPQDDFGIITIIPRHDDSALFEVHGALRPRSGDFERRCDWHMNDHGFVTGVTGVIGKLMPERRDSRQQPKSRAMVMLQARSDRRRMVNLDNKYPVMAKRRACEFFHDVAGGIEVYSSTTGQHLGYIKPTVSDAVLRASPGIQSWSK